MPVVMTIAGSDSGGGAGIEADLKTFQALGVFGTAAVTCLTAQNPCRVAGIAPVDPDFVALQIRTVCDGFPVAAVKTGMLYSADIITAVASTVARLGLRPLIVDPVMVSASGVRLLRPDAVHALCAKLLPLARVVTPNLMEAEILCGRPIRSLDALKAAAAEISRKYGIACVAKGGHLSGAVVTDMLCDGGRTRVFSQPRVRLRGSHGTGCAFSAALTALLAGGESLPRAVESAKRFVTRALAQARPAGKHRPLNFTPHA